MQMFQVRTAVVSTIYLCVRSIRRKLEGTEELASTTSSVNEVGCPYRPSNVKTLVYERRRVSCIGVE